MKKVTVGKLENKIMVNDKWESLKDPYFDTRKVDNRNIIENIDNDEWNVILIEK